MIAFVQTKFEDYEDSSRPEVLVVPNEDVGKYLFFQKDRRLEDYRVTDLVGIVVSPSCDLSVRIENTQYNLILRDVVTGRLING